MAKPVPVTDDDINLLSLKMAELSLSDQKNDRLLLNLPLEVLLHIFSYFSPRTLTSVAQVSRYCRFLANQKELWQKKIIKNFPYLSDQHSIRYKIAPVSLYRQEYTRYKNYFKDFNLKLIFQALQGKVKKIENNSRLSEEEKNSYLFFALISGHIQVETELEEKQILSDFFVIAAQRNCLTVLQKSWQEMEPYIDWQEKKRALDRAVLAGHLRIIFFILLVAKPDEIEFFYGRALQFAAESNVGHVVDFLLQKDYSKYIPSYMVVSAFEVAAKRNHRAIVKIFWQNQIEITPLQKMDILIDCILLVHIDVVSFFYKKSLIEWSDIFSSKLKAALIQLIKSNNPLNIPMIIFLLEQKQNKHLIVIALKEAVNHDQAELVEKILRNFNASIGVEAKREVFFVAVRKNRDLAKKMLEFFGSPESTEIFGYACQEGLCKLLGDLLATVNEKIATKEEYNKAIERYFCPQSNLRLEGSLRAKYIQQATKPKKEPSRQKKSCVFS